MKEKTFSRAELYDLVWGQSLNKLSEQLNVTPQLLKDFCKEYNIPLPNRGYWTQVRFNKQVVKVPLPKMENGHIKINLISDVTPKKFKTDYHKRAYELEQQSNLHFQVPKRIAKYHPTVRNSKKLLEQLDESEDIRFWEVSQEHEVLPIHTDPKMRSRALRFMNTLILVIEAINGNIVFEYGRCHIQLFGQKTEINLRQKYHRIREKDKSGWNRESWQKSDKLEFQAGPSFRQKNWIDKKTICLEEYLPQIVAWIEKDCKYWHDVRAEQAIESNKRALLEQKEKAIKEVKEQEMTKFKTLLVNTKRFEKANAIREYIKTMEERNTMDDETKAYLKWARLKADWIDPLIDIEDNILGQYKDVIN